MNLAKGKCDDQYLVGVEDPSAQQRAPKIGLRGPRFQLVWFGEEWREDQLQFR